MLKKLARVLRVIPDVKPDVAIESVVSLAPVEPEPEPLPVPPLSVVHGKGHVFEIAEGTRFDPKAQWRIEGTRNTLVVEEGCDLGKAKIILRGRNLTVRIGAGCRFKAGTLSVAGDGSRAEIGARTTWESGQIIAEGGQLLSIGTDCMFSNGIMIRTADGHGIFDKSTGEMINPPSTVIIGDHVWIGNGARVNKGAHVGGGTVVAHMSVLSGAAEPDSVYAGVPARQLKSGIAWSRTYDFADIPEEFL